jgi:hypothetical protein
MMKNNREENNTTGSHLRKYSSKFDDGEGFKGNEDSTQDKALELAHQMLQL